MPETLEQSAPDVQKAKWVHTLSGPWKTETYGVIQFLRAHPVIRGIVAVIGVVICIGAVAVFGGIKIPGITISLIPCIILGPWLILVVTVSGPNFEVTFPSREAAQEREKAEIEFKKSNTVEDELKLDLSRLNEYYVINQNQARSSFRWAVFTMLLGFGTIIAGIWIFYFRGGQPDTFMASLTTAAGVVANLISALFLHLHSKIQSRSLYYYDRLSRLQNLSMAIRLVDSHENQDARQAARNVVIRELVSGVRPSLPQKVEAPAID